MADWALIILTALGSGALASIITTYGTQTRERRQARAQVREAIRRAQDLLSHVCASEQLTVALDSLETSAMLAGLPQYLTILHRDALSVLRQITADVIDLDQPPGEESAHAINDMAFAADHVVGETTRLLTDATWHPILRAPYRWWRTRQLARVMDTLPRPGPRQPEKRRWERDTIRKAKRERKRGRRTL